MATTEQPLKKRKLYEPSPPPPQSPPPPPPPQPPPQPQQQPALTFQQSNAAPALSQDEILRRRRNQEEIRNVYECYKRIKFCISQNDDRLSSELEQAYLSLITASRGCTSVQRLVADFIPRFASYCPTALEAAAKVVINMHNWKLALIGKGDDTDGVAFDTAKACIFGLADICQSAAAEAPTSSVIQGICTTVFHDALTFFISCFEGKDIFEIADKEISGIQDAHLFSEHQKEILNKEQSVLLKLSEFRVLCFLRIFFTCPKNSIATCFELIGSTGSEECKREGYYLLHQLTNRLDEAVGHPRNGGNSMVTSSAKSRETSSKSMDADDGLAAGGKQVSDNRSLVLKNCLLGLAVEKDHSLKSWICSRFKKLSKSASSQVVSDISSVLEGILPSFLDEVKAEKTHDEGDEDGLDSAKYASDFLGHELSSQKVTQVSGRPAVPLGAAHRSSMNSNANSGELRSLVFDSKENGDLPNTRSSVSMEVYNQQILSPISRTPSNLRNSSSDVGHHVMMENHQILNVDPPQPALRSSAGGMSCSMESPLQRLPLSHSSTNQVIWYTDGDPAAADIFPASKQLWLGSLGPDASEILVRHKFEMFGPVNQFAFFAFKGFALVEYQNIMDAVRAREIMQGNTLWGADLRIKFLDIGLGTKGSINGVAIGSSCYIYVGGVKSHWMKDDVMHELRKALQKGPRMVTDLGSEGALLMEFDTPEEATIAMNHLRHWRKVRSDCIQPLNLGPANTSMRTEGIRPSSASVYVGMGSNFCANSTVGPSHFQNVLENHSGSHVPRMSRLSSLLSHLSTKYNVKYDPGYKSNHMPGNCETGFLGGDTMQTNTLRISIPNGSSLFITEDELLAICNLAIDNKGSIIRLMRETMPMGSCWLVECSSMDSANTLLKTLRDSPGLFFQIEFRYCEENSLDRSKVRGKIVLCDWTYNGTVSAGAVGAIMQDDGFKDAAFSFPISSTYLSTNDGNRPDLSAPGVDILAAWSEGTTVTGYKQGDKRVVPYNIISGTSMACPHATAAALYVKSFNPTMSPAAIKSALMTTATPMSSSANSEAEFAYGSGQINPTKAARPGLVYDMGENDYVKFLCGQGYSTNNLRIITGDKTCCTCQTNATVWDLNYPSFTLSSSKNSKITRVFHRTVTNVGTPVSTYMATIVAPEGLTVRVEPRLITFTSIAQKQSFVVSVTADINDSMLSASLVWDDGVHLVRTPIVAYASP
ncbi:hypothetical protein HAX54_010768 [Datura stramonium]|uniref:RRM domain-containing protein n=1 Tax=Datura stramonium TaxID=4076 RepID=A0ABS8RJX3_DATST|nr:hypothetical protein [Datura stramonium]